MTVNKTILFAEEMIPGYPLGANSYVRKPLNFVQLTEAVRQVGLYRLLLNKVLCDKGK